MHRYAERVFATVKKDQRRANAETRITEPRSSCPHCSGTGQERSQANSKSLHHRTRTDQAHSDDYEHQKWRSDHLFFYKITQRCAPVLTLGEPAHDLEPEEIGSQIGCYIDDRYKSELIGLHVSERDHHGGQADQHCGP